MARKAGLGIYVFNMIGLPGETYSDHMETVSLNRQCQPDGHYTGIFYPYPGTDLYDLCIREGYISKYVDNRLERRQPVISFPQFTKRQIQEAYTWFNYRVYRGYKPLWWILVQTLRTRIRSSISLNILFRRILQWPALDYLREKLIGQK